MGLLTLSSESNRRARLGNVAWVGGVLWKINNKRVPLPIVEPSYYTLQAILECPNNQFLSLLRSQPLQN